MRSRNFRIKPEFGSNLCQVPGRTKAVSPDLSNFSYNQYLNSFHLKGFEKSPPLICDNEKGGPDPGSWISIFLQYSLLIHSINIHPILEKFFTP